MLLIFAFFIMWLVAGLRYETGGDWPTYTLFFENVETISNVLKNEAPIYNESYMEPAYKLLNSAIKEANGNIQIVFLIVALINACLLFKCLKSYTNYPLMGVFIYFSSIYMVIDMIAIRQAVAVMCFFVAIKFVYTRKFVPYLIVLLVAFLFHRSVILLFPLYFFINREASASIYWTTFLLSLAIFFLNIQWMNGLLTFVANLIGGTNGAIIKMYQSSSTYGVSRVFSVGAIINIILFIIFMAKRREFLKFKYFTVFFNLFMLNFVVFFVFYELIEVSNRYRYYFLISNLILLPYFIDIYSNWGMKFSVFIMICCFCFLYGRPVYLESPSSIAFNPYQNYLIHLMFDTKSDGFERMRKGDEEYIQNRKRE